MSCCHTKAGNDLFLTSNEEAVRSSTLWLRMALIIHLKRKAEGSQPSELQSGKLESENCGYDKDYLLKYNLGVSLEIKLNLTQISAVVFPTNSPQFLQVLGTYFYKVSLSLSFFKNRNNFSFVSHWSVLIRNPLPFFLISLIQYGSH